MTALSDTPTGIVATIGESKELGFFLAVSFPSSGWARDKLERVQMALVGLPWTGDEIDVDPYSFIFLVIHADGRLSTPQADYDLKTPVDVGMLSTYIEDMVASA